MTFHEMNDRVEKTLSRLEVLIAEDRHESLETDDLEIKPVPADGTSWRECHKSVNAFLNTRGGILLLGFREELAGPQKRWVFTGYRPDAEPKLKEFPTLFQDRRGHPLKLEDAFPPMQLRPFGDGHVAVVYVEELPTDQKYAFLKGEAWKRVLTGDHKLKEAEIESQEEYRQELWHARELNPVGDARVEDLDIDVLNEYIQQLNRPVKVETIKADLAAALPFLCRKGFVKDNRVTTLGMLVCGRHPEDSLGFRCHVHGYVEQPQIIAQDKQDLIGNILPLMQQSLGYILRNIQVGISIENGGTARPQYPENVLRETVNNALAHRDYSINKQAIISIKPGLSVTIRNPGSFRRNLLIEHPDASPPIRRIIPEAKARNPKLADVLRVYRKWEGKGIGMATLVNLCLANKMDIPSYRLYTEEVSLELRAGALYDERMKAYLSGFDAHLESKLGMAPSEEQLYVLSYLIKSQWRNQNQEYTILLTPDNNHFEQLQSLERAGLIHKHPLSSVLYPIYTVDAVLMRNDFRPELEDTFGPEGLKAMDVLSYRCLNLIYWHECRSKLKSATAKTAAFALWYEQPSAGQSIRDFDAFYRKVRRSFNKLEKAGFIFRPPGARGYSIRQDYRQTHLL